jgi:hypothetical protein
MYHRATQLTNTVVADNIAHGAPMPRKPQTHLRLEPELKRRISERARIRSMSEPQLIREFISIGLGGADAHLERVFTSLDALRHQVEDFSQIERAVDSRDAKRQAALTSLLERVLVQSTEILMILRVVTYKDRPDDYALAMKQAQSTIANRTSLPRSGNTTAPNSGESL